MISNTTFIDIANETNAAMLTDDWKINMRDPWQVLWWSRYLGLSKSELESAVLIAGTEIADIQRYRAQQPSKSVSPPVMSSMSSNYPTGRNMLTRSPF